MTSKHYTATFTDLEKEFFTAFGIEPKTVKGFLCVYSSKPEERNCSASDDCKSCEHFRSHEEYPAITCQILLKLICIHIINACSPDLVASNPDELKIKVLENLIANKDDFAVQQCIWDLFEEY